MGIDIEAFLYGVSVWAIPAILAITLHEASHGFVALRFGDDTAYRLGRVTFNPFRHIDLWGTIIIPTVLLLTSPFVFGWAKPVPVDFRRLRNPRRDMVWVAAAGPGINLALAVVSALLIHLALVTPGTVGDWMFHNLRNSIVINLILAVFNMLPVPPLDGGRVAVGLLPRSLAWPLARLEPYGLFIVIGVIFLLPWMARSAGIPFDPVGWLIDRPVTWLMRMIAMLTGLG
ncbi:MAG: site-2 protease family protein [Rhodospirillales bacterium]